MDRNILADHVVGKVLDDRYTERIGRRKIQWTKDKRKTESGKSKGLNFVSFGVNDFLFGFLWPLISNDIIFGKYMARTKGILNIPFKYCVGNHYVSPSSFVR